MSLSGDPGRERRSGSIFRLPFRSNKNNKPASRSQSVSANGSRTPPHRSSLDEVKRNSGSYVHSGLRNGRVTDEYGTVHDVSTAKTRSSKGAFPVISVADTWQRNKQTGEVIDHTDMLHSLAPTESQEEAPYMQRIHSGEGTEPGQDTVDKFPENVWERIITRMEIADQASLALSCKPFQTLVGTETWKQLSEEEHRAQRLSFLPRIDYQVPNHLLCFDCAVYHVRTQRGQETLRPANVLNAVYECPNASNPNKINPRIRLTMGRIFPYTILQLAMRAQRFTPQYGLDPTLLSRRYKDREDSGSTWSHQTRYTTVNNHLLMRVTSQCFAPPGLPPSGERHLLYSREDFVPYFSVCPHWRDGVLLPSVKCALSHIPKPPEGSGVNQIARETKLHFHPTNPIVVLCENCRPMRRCPECPTEYLIEIKMAEDKSDPDPRKLFKQALVVTRWSDLGDGTSPLSPEWAAGCAMEGFEFDSIKALGKRAVSGQFESEVYGDVIPGQRMLSMNPEKVKLGERGHEWY